MYMYVCSFGMPYVIRYVHMIRMIGTVCVLGLPYNSNTYAMFPIFSRCRRVCVCVSSWMRYGSAKTATTTQTPNPRTGLHNPA